MDPSRDPGAGPGPAVAGGAASETPILGRVFARLQRSLRPPRRLRPTRAGWSFFALTFGVGFAALNTGNNLLYLVLALMLSFLVLSGVLSESALRGIQVKRRLPRELFAGGSCAIELTITNRQRRVPSFAVVVEDRVREPGGAERAAGRAFVLRVGAEESERRVYRFQPRQRGRIEFTRFRVFTRYPFGLFSKSLVIEDPLEALVFPALDPAPRPRSFGGPRAEGAQTSGDGGRGADAAGLREFVRGDSVRHVHWRASVRRGELLVREVESERDAELEVRLRTAGTRAGEVFERGVRWAASEAVAFLETNARVALRTDTIHIPADAGPRQRARLLAFLALVEPDAADPGPA